MPYNSLEFLLRGMVPKLIGSTVAWVSSEQGMEASQSGTSVIVVSVVVRAVLRAMKESRMDLWKLIPQLNFGYGAS